MKLVKKRKPPSEAEIRKVAEWLTYQWLDEGWIARWPKHLKWKKQQVIQFLYYKPSALGTRVYAADKNSPTAYYTPGYKPGCYVNPHRDDYMHPNFRANRKMHWRDHFTYILEKTEELFPGYTDKVLKIAEMQLDEKAVVNL